MSKSSSKITLPIVITALFNTVNAVWRRILHVVIIRASLPWLIGIVQALGKLIILRLYEKTSVPSIFKIKMSHNATIFAFIHFALLRCDFPLLTGPGPIPLKVKKNTGCIMCKGVCSVFHDMWTFFLYIFCFLNSCWPLICYFRLTKNWWKQPEWWQE